MSAGGFLESGGKGRNGRKQWAYGGVHGAEVFVGAVVVCLGVEWPDLGWILGLGGFLRGGCAGLLRYGEGCGAAEEGRFVASPCGLRSGLRQSGGVPWGAVDPGLRPRLV